jgi:HEAT repeat protein
MRLLPFALLLLVPSPLLAVAPPNSNEPVYRGKRLGAWLADLKSKDADVRFDAAIALGRMGPKGKAAIPGLVAALKDKDEDVRYAVCIALGRIGPAAVKPLAALLRDKDARDTAGSALRRIGPPAIEALIGALQNSDQEVRTTASWTLSRMGKPALPSLVKVLEGKAPAGRKEAAEILQWMRLSEPDTKQVLAALIVALQDRDEDLRWAARRALVAIGKPALVPVIGVLEGKGSNGRAEAAAILQELRLSEPEAKRAVAPLIVALQDRDENLRNTARRALVSLGRPALAPLIGLLQSKSPQSRGEAAAMLQEIRLSEPDVKKAVAALIAALDDRDEEVRNAVRHSLSEIGPPALAAVISVLEGKKSQLRKEAAAVLAWMRLDAADQKKVVTALIAALDDKDEDIRIAMTSTLTQVGTPAVSALIGVLEKGSLKARIAATLALGGMNQKAKAAVPALLKAFEDEDDGLSYSALQALKLIDPKAARRAEGDDF